MLEIGTYRALCSDDNIVITQHALKRFRERGIFLDDIENAILTGNIIEEYPDDTPYPSCLILGKAAEKQPIHIVISTDNTFLYIITAYFPDSAKWDETFSIRKENVK